MLAGPRICPHCTELDPLFEQKKTLFLAKGPRPFNYPRIKIPIWDLCAGGCKGGDCKNSLL